MIQLVWELGGDRIVWREHPTENPVPYTFLPAALVPKWESYRKHGVLYSHQTNRVRIPRSGEPRLSKAWEPLPRP